MLPCFSALALWALPSASKASNQCVRWLIALVACSFGYLNHFAFVCVCAYVYLLSHHHHHPPLTLPCHASSPPTLVSSPSLMVAEAGLLLLLFVVTAPPKCVVCFCFWKPVVALNCCADLLLVTLPWLGFVLFCFVVCSGCSLLLRMVILRGRVLALQLVMVHDRAVLSSPPTFFSPPCPVALPLLTTSVCCEAVDDDDGDGGTIPLRPPLLPSGGLLGRGEGERAGLFSWGFGPCFTLGVLAVPTLGVASAIERSSNSRTRVGCDVLMNFSPVAQGSFITRGFTPHCVPAFHMPSHHLPLLSLFHSHDVVAVLHQ